MHSIIDDLNWRYATKKFDPSKKIEEGTVNIILEALRLAPSSYGLQPTKILVIKNPELRSQLVEAAYGQKQVEEASHLLVLASYHELSPELIHSFIEEVATTRNQSRESLTGFETMLLNYANAKDTNFLSDWMKRQNYIVLGHLMQICAQLRIDATPMEGVNYGKFDELLELGSKNLKTDLVIPIGYRHEEDAYLQRKKVRRKFHDVVEFI